MDESLLSCFRVYRRQSYPRFHDRSSFLLNRYFTRNASRFTATALMSLIPNALLERAMRSDALNSLDAINPFRLNPSLHPTRPRSACVV